jgi:putative NIF3 family GTP cyclohydrolase 1 type 2
MITEENQSLKHGEITRRKFVYSAAVSAGAIMSAPLLGKASSLVKTDQQYTVQQIVDLFISQVPGGKKTQTVDTLKSGSPDTVVTGIVTAMFATIEVIRKAIDLGANFIIVHEPTFYNHNDNTQWLQNDDVYQYKAGLLKQHNIAVWRNHDYIHTLKPDGVTKGVLEQLGWMSYSDKDLLNMLTMPAVSLKHLVGYTKAKLNIEKVRYVGDPEQICKRVLFIPGASGGQMQIGAISKYKPDVLLCGEIQEWETAEYVRDARAKGDNISLVVLGHIASEEPGSQFMLEWLNKNVPGVKVTRISPGNSLKFM